MRREFSIQTVEGDGTPDQVCLRAHIPQDLRYLEGHFPGDPIVPGIAQLLPLVHEPVQQAWPDLGPPRAIRRLKFLAALRPGHTLQIRLTRKDHKVKFEIHRGEVACTRGTLLFDLK